MAVRSKYGKRHDEEQPTSGQVASASQLFLESDSFKHLGHIVLTLAIVICLVILARLQPRVVKGPKRRSHRTHPTTNLDDVAIPNDQQAKVGADVDKLNRIIARKDKEVKRLEQALDEAKSSQNDTPIVERTNATSSRNDAPMVEKPPTRAEILLTKELERVKVLLDTVQNARDKIIGEHAIQTGFANAALAKERQAKASLQEEVSRRAGQLVEAKKKLEEKDGIINRLEVVAKSESKRVEQIIANLKSDVAKLNAEKSAPNPEVETIKKALRDAKEDKARLAQQLTDKTVEVEETGKRRRGKDAETKELKSTNASLMKALDEAKSKEILAASEVAALQKQLEEVKKEKKQVFQKSKANLSSEDDEKKTLHARLAEKVVQLNLTSEEVRRLHKQLEDSHQAYDLLQIYAKYLEDAKSNAEAAAMNAQSELISVKELLQGSNNKVLIMQNLLSGREVANRMLSASREEPVKMEVPDARDVAVGNDSMDGVELKLAEEPVRVLRPRTNLPKKSSVRAPAFTHYPPVTTGNNPPPPGLHYILRTAFPSRLREVSFEAWFVTNNIQFAINCAGRTFESLLRMSLKEFNGICPEGDYGKYRRMQNTVRRHVMSTPPAKWKGKAPASAKRV